MSQELTPKQPDQLEYHPSNYVQVQVRGENPSTWRDLRGTLVKTVFDILGGLSDVANSGKLREEAKRISLAALDYAKAKLEKPGLENAKIEAEIREKYAEIEKKHAETRLKSAEADKAEFENTIRKLKVSLGLAQVLIMGEKDDESILFSLQIEQFLRIVKELEPAKV